MGTWVHYRWMRRWLSHLFHLCGPLYTLWTISYFVVTMTKYQTKATWGRKGYFSSQFEGAVPSGGEGGTARVKLLASWWRRRGQPDWPHCTETGSQQRGMLASLSLFFLFGPGRNSTGHIQGESPLLGLPGKRLTGSVRGFSPGWLLPMKSNLRTP